MTPKPPSAFWGWSQRALGIKTRHPVPGEGLQPIGDTGEGTIPAALKELMERHRGLWALGGGLPCVSSGKAFLRRQDFEHREGLCLQEEGQEDCWGQKGHHYQ